MASTHKVTIVMAAQDQASAAVRRVRGEFDKFRKDGGIPGALMGGVGIGAGLGAFGLVSSGVGMAV